MATDALTKTKSRNLSPVDEKALAVWHRLFANLDRAKHYYDLADQRFDRARANYEAGTIPEPDVKWFVLGATFKDDQTHILYMDDFDDIIAKARRMAEWRWPRPSEAEILVEVAKVREFRLRREMLDLRTNYHEADERLYAAPDLQAVQYKLEYLFGDGDSDAAPEWPRKFTDAIIADVRRLNQQSKEA